MKITMYMILTSENDEVYQAVVQQLYSFYPAISISPCRPYAGMRNSVEFYSNFTIEENELADFLSKLSDSFDELEEDEAWECYGITSKVFDDNVYYIYLEKY